MKFYQPTVVRSKVGSLGGIPPFKVARFLAKLIAISSFSQVTRLVPFYILFHSHTHSHTHFHTHQPGTKLSLSARNFWPQKIRKGEHGIMTVADPEVMGGYWGCKPPPSRPNHGNCYQYFPLMYSCYCIITMEIAHTQKVDVSKTLCTCFTLA